MVAMSETIAE